MYIWPIWHWGPFVFNLLGGKNTWWHYIYGELYDIDLRLRPNGKDGLLISNFSAYQKYLLQSAWTWEHQSLTRSRFIIGRNHTQIKFNKLRHQVIAQARQPKHLKTEICQMRDKMRAHLLKTHAEFDLKQSILSHFLFPPPVSNKNLLIRSNLSLEFWNWRWIWLLEPREQL